MKRNHLWCSVLILWRCATHWSMYGKHCSFLKNKPYVGLKSGDLVNLLFIRCRRSSSLSPSCLERQTKRSNHRKYNLDQLNNTFEEEMQCWEETWRCLAHLASLSRYNLDQSENSWWDERSWRAHVTYRERGGIKIPARTVMAIWQV